MSVKRDIIRKKLSLLHISVVLHLYSHSTHISASSYVTCFVHLIFSFSCSIMTHRETSILVLLLLFHYLPFLSRILSSPSTSSLPAQSLTFHLSLSHYSEGATMLSSWPSVMAHGLSGWEIANVAQMKY